MENKLEFPVTGTSTCWVHFQILIYKGERRLFIICLIDFHRDCRPTKSQQLGQNYLKLISSALAPLLMKNSVFMIDVFNTYVGVDQKCSFQSWNRYGLIIRNTLFIVGWVVWTSIDCCEVCTVLCSHFLMSQHVKCGVCFEGFTVQEWFIIKQKAKHDSTYAAPRKRYNARISTRLLPRRNSRPNSARKLNTSSRRLRIAQGNGTERDCKQVKYHDNVLAPAVMPPPETPEHPARRG